MKLICGDVLGILEYQDEKTGVNYVKSHKTGRILKVADLVQDNPKSRDKISAYLREVKSVDDIDIIIALGMAKEGFDWIWCEHALTIGYRSSLTEIVQIIGRATRGYVALYRYVAALDTVFVLAVRAQREDGFKHQNGL
jgi:superfamily II DNA or RNA helicase